MKVARVLSNQTVYITGCVKDQGYPKIWLGQEYLGIPMSLNGPMDSSIPILMDPPIILKPHPYEARFLWGSIVFEEFVYLTNEIPFEQDISKPWKLGEYMMLGSSMLVPLDQQQHTPIPLQLQRKLGQPTKVGVKLSIYMELIEQSSFRSSASNVEIRDEQTLNQEFYVYIDNELLNNKPYTSLEIARKNLLKAMKKGEPNKRGVISKVMIRYDKTVEEFESKVTVVRKQIHETKS